MPIKGLGARRFWAAVGLSGAAALLVLVVAPLIGPTRIDMARVWAGAAPDYQVFATLRVPRVLVAMIAGGALALAGAVFQALLRDALATPDTLGVSSGASLGAVAAITFGGRWAGDLPVVWIGSMCGAGTVLLVVLGIAGGRRRLSSFTLLLTGIAINSMCAAMILFVHSIADFTKSFSISRWLMGGIEPVGYGALASLLVFIGPAMFVVLRNAAAWNLMAVSEDFAAARGVSVPRLLATGYVAASLLTAPVIALTGPIGFVGLMVPHALRLRVGADHRVLLPCAVLVGAAFLAACDAVARVVIAPADLPVGVITAMLGGPFFIWLLSTRWKRGNV